MGDNIDVCVGDSIHKKTWAGEGDEEDWGRRMLWGMMDRQATAKQMHRKGKAKVEKERAHVGIVETGHQARDCRLPSNKGIGMGGSKGNGEGGSKGGKPSGVSKG